MSELQSVLRDYVGDISAGGGRRDTRKFMQRLENVRSSAHTRHWLLVAALGCVFVLGLALMWMYREDIAIVSSIFAATGLSTGVVIARLTKIWKELTFLDMFILFAAEVEPDQLPDLISIIINKLEV
jgi:hypothetical protein